MARLWGGVGVNARRSRALLALLLLFQTALSALAFDGAAERGHAICLAKQTYDKGEKPAPAAPSHAAKCCVAHFSESAFAPPSPPAGLIEIRIALSEGGLCGRVSPVPQRRDFVAFPRAPPLLSL